VKFYVSLTVRYTCYDDMLKSRVLEDPCMAECLGV